MTGVKRLVRTVRTVRFGRFRGPGCPLAVRTRRRAPTTTPRRRRMASKRDVRVPAEAGLALGAWLFLPDEDRPHPAITMAHGFAGTKAQGLECFAEAFAAAGFAVLVHDHRNFGTSG